MPEIFHEAIARINPGMESDVIERFLADIKLSLKNEDLGKAFYEKLTERSGTFLIENQHLTQLRDWLLPMLMNDQVMVA